MKRDILKKELDEKTEEIFYFKEKCNKLEAVNSNLRISSKDMIGADEKIKELEQQNYVLSVKLKEFEQNEKPAQKIVTLNFTMFPIFLGRPLQKG